MSLAPYRVMWTFVMFDLPVDSKQARKEYTRFRKTLLQLGLTRMQFSIYAKALPSEDAGDCLATIVRMAIPPRGEVRILMVTDRQFGPPRCLVWVRTGIRNEGIRFLEASARKESRMDEGREGVPGSLLGV